MSENKVPDEIVEDIKNGPTPVEIPILPHASGSFVDSLPVETQLHLFKVKAANFEIASLVSSLSALNEAQRRVVIESATLPGKVKETQQMIEEKQQSGSLLYNELKELLGCPTDQEINLDTGEFM